MSKEPRKTKKEIIEETLKMIKHQGRAISPTSTGLADACVYRKDGHPGCAVGRCMMPSAYNTDMESSKIDEALQFVEAKRIDDILLEPYRGHGLGFWKDLQALHDTGKFWNGRTLTSEGALYLQQLEQEYYES